MRSEHSSTRYSPFTALMILLAALLILTVGQTYKLYAMRAKAWNETDRGMKLAIRLEDQMKWVAPLSGDLVKMAGSHPDAARIMGEMNLTPAPPLEPAHPNPVGIGGTSSQSVSSPANFQQK